jgi:hypothetical protein
MKSLSAVPTACAHVPVAVPHCGCSALLHQEDPVSAPLLQDVAWGRGNSTLGGASGGQWCGELQRMAVAAQLQLKQVTRGPDRRCWLRGLTAPAAVTHALANGDATLPGLYCNSRST